MKAGALVIKKNRFMLDSQLLGVVIEKSEVGEDTWLVMWSTKDSYKLRHHRGSALLEVDDTTSENLVKRGCISGLAT